MQVSLRRAFKESQLVFVDLSFNESLPALREFATKVSLLSYFLKVRFLIMLQF